MTTYLVGAERYAAAGTLSQIAVGQSLHLRREADNDYDPRAVSVWTLDERKLGYVPRADNKSLANLLDAGVPLAAGVAEVRHSLRPHVGLTIQVAV
ncbi:HIRAN domain-containing protein [Paracoccus albicereus]|nr:HIRAN domain-containing protein [Paracoccus albicereus]